jgi:hypothetical protein
VPSVQGAVALPARAGRRVRRSIVFAVLLVGLAIPGVVLASHQFTDVPNSNTFHNSISNIKIAGITAGCGGGKYCPNNAVTRGQMAAFLNRGLGRGNVFLAEGVSISDTPGTVVEGAINTPGAGYVLATSASMAYTDDASGCPCYLQSQIRNEDNDEVSFFYASTMPAYAASTNAFANLADTHVFPVAGPGFHVFALELAGSGATFGADGTLTLTWVPFDEEGMANTVTSTTQHHVTQQVHR